MALKIRLRQQGRKNRQTFRLVVTDIRNPRDGKYLEMLGWYNPFSNAKDSQIDLDRIRYWVGQGAELSECAQDLIERNAPDAMKEIRANEHARRMKKIANRRKGKKAAAPKAAEASKAAAPKKAPAKKAAKKAAE